MNHNQFKIYLNSVFSDSIYNCKVNDDYNKMSHIDFCVQLTKKTIEQLNKYVRNIKVHFHGILTQPELHGAKSIQEFYKKCQSGIVRHYDLTPQIISTLLDSLCEVISSERIKSYLDDEINRIISEKEQDIFRTINIVQQEKMFEEGNENIFSSNQLHESLKSRVLKTAIEDLSYEKEIIETIIQKISSERGVPNLPDSLFLPIPIHEVPKRNSPNDEVNRITSMYNTIIGTLEVPNRKLIQQLYERCRSEFVRDNNLTNRIVEKIIENLPEEVIDELSNELKEEIKDTPLENLSYELKKRIVEEIIQAIAEEEVPNIPDSLFLPEL